MLLHFLINKRITITLFAMKNMYPGTQLPFFWYSDRNKRLPFTRFHITRHHAAKQVPHKSEYTYIHIFKTCSLRICLCHLYWCSLQIQFCGVCCGGMSSGVVTAILAAVRPAGVKTGIQK